MAKKAKAEPGTFRDENEKQRTKEAEGHGVAAIRGNGFDPDAVKGFVGRIQNLNGDLLKEQSAYMTACKVIRDDIKEVYDEAKDAGIPKKELKRVIELLKLEGKIEDLREGLEEGEQQDNYDKLLLALGKLSDLPLGQAALAKTSPNGAAAHQPSA